MTIFTSRNAYCAEELTNIKCVIEIPFPIVLCIATALCVWEVVLRYIMGHQNSGLTLIIASVIWHSVRNITRKHPV